MDLSIFPGKLHGCITAIPSKSQAHRLLICAAFSDNDTDIHCHATNQDIQATANCLCALGASIRKTEYGYRVHPVTTPPQAATLDCGESGSTLRFMLPIVGALGVDATFQMHGRLPCRPLSPLWEEMERMGCSLTRPTENTIRCTGKLQPGRYIIAGNVSSQYISGLLFATALLKGESNIEITGETESQPYIALTQNALSLFGVSTENYYIAGCYPFKSPRSMSVEGDWSNAAFFLAANALGSQIEVKGLDSRSAQGDRAIMQLLGILSKDVTIDAKDIPDLVPILSIVAGNMYGATFENIGRLRLKESDRVATVANMLKQLGAATVITENTLCVKSSDYSGCTIDAAGDHRIAMSAAIAATVSNGPITILGAECVSKSYPSFWDEYKQLGGQYEQHIR